MTAHANGTPTALGIPTLNTAQDDLTGAGVNEIVAVVDSKIQGRMFAPDSPLDTQVVKWSETSDGWVADYVKPSELAQEDATTGQALVWDGTKWSPGGGAGTELDFAQITADPSAITATTEATAVAFITGNNVAYDGTRVKLELFVPDMDVSPGFVTLLFLRGTSVVGRSYWYGNTSGSHGTGFSFSTFDTPAAGSHVYKAAAFVGSGSFVPRSGPGGAGNPVPSYLRITKA